MARSTHHVVHNQNGGWDVRKGGAQRASGHFKTKKQAIDAGRKISQNLAATRARQKGNSHALWDSSTSFWGAAIFHFPSLPQNRFCILVAHGGK